MAADVMIDKLKEELTSLFEWYVKQDTSVNLAN